MEIPAGVSVVLSIYALQKQWAHNQYIGEVLRFKVAKSLSWYLQQYFSQKYRIFESEDSLVRNFKELISGIHVSLRIEVWQ